MSHFSHYDRFPANMKRRAAITRVGIAILIMAAWLLPLRAGATAAAAPNLIISQFKFTSSNGQFVTFYNQSSSPIDLSQYEVDYISSTNKVSSLPVSGQLEAHSFYMLSDDQSRLCYQMTINAESLGFATTSGTLQVWQISTDKLSKQLQDSVTWASKVNAGAVTLPAQNTANSVSLLRQPTDSLGDPQISAVGSGTWQAVAPDTTNPCSLDIINTITTTPTPISNPGNQLGLGQAPPATIINLASDDSDSLAGPSLPSSDVGLAAPQLTELLPNPVGTGNDGTDEYVELYNSNPVSFDLSGFILQTGATTKHSFTFPAGTILPPGSFGAFFASETGLSLSNTTGQADLQDPFGNALSQTDVYGTAKDGQAWALANGKWYWTTTPTPNAANVIKQPVTSTSKKSSKSTSQKSTSSAVKGASTTAGSAGSTADASDAADTTPAPIHPLVLAVVAVLAVGYGVYEYRHDLANRLYQFRRNRAARRAARI